MDFFNSLSQIAKNRNNFKQWEKQQKEKQDKREVLYEQNQYSEEEIEKAKALGKNIIEAVDVMDNHSESVAENVETAIQPIVAGLPMITGFGGAGAYLKYIERPISKQIHNIGKQTLYENEAAIKLADEISQYNVKTGKTEPYFFPYYFSDKSLIKKIKDPVLRKRSMDLYNNFMQKTAHLRKKRTLGAWGAFGAFILSFIGANIYAAKVQVDSSKIARFQARQALEDPKSFVNYTPEQIENAKKQIENNPELKKKKNKNKLKTGMFSSIINLFKDRSKYKKALKNDKDESKLVTRELTPEELIQAKKDKEVIQRVVKRINNEAEKYSENMEVAAGVIINGTPILGGVVGTVVGAILNKFGVIEKYVNKQVEKFGSDKTKQAYEELKNTKKDSPKYHRAWHKFHRSFHNDAFASAEVIKDGIKQSNHAPKDKLQLIKRFFTSALAHKWGKNIIIGGIGSMVTGFAGLLIGLKLQKSAARAGRYTAKRELEKDPRNFIGYTDEEYDKVDKNKVNNKKETSKIKEYALFIPNVIKQYFAYEKYRKNEFKENQILREQLQKQDVSEAQLKDAKNLQRKIFNTFEKIDDKSQAYSESMEAAVEIAQPFVLYGGLIAMFSPFVYIATQIKKGNISGAKVLNKVTSFFSKASDKLKSKWFKKYLENVEKNIPNKVQGQRIESKPIGTLLNGVDLKNDSIFTIISKAFKNLQLSPQKLREMPEDELHSEIYKLKNTLTTYISTIDKGLATKVEEMFQGLLTTSPELRVNVIELIVNPKVAKTMDPKEYAQTLKSLQEITRRTVGYKKMDKLFENIKVQIDNLPIDDIKNQIIAAFEQEPQIAQFIKPEEINKVFDLIEKLKQASTYEYEDIILKVLSQENAVKLINSIEKFAVLTKKTSQQLQESPVFGALIGGIKASKIAPSKELISILKKANPNIRVNEKGEVLVNDIWETVKRTKDIKFSDFNLSTNPKEKLNIIKQHIEKMSDEEFAQQMENFKFSSMDKKTMLEIIPKLEKIIDNIPKEEINKIMDTLLKEFNAHPDEFIQMVKSGKIGSIFMTPGLKKALVTAGISWTAFTLIMTYAIESWLAEMQLKAGRLGVMEALNSLEDDRYYANIESTTTAKKGIAKQDNVSNTNPQSNLLDRIKTTH